MRETLELIVKKLVDMPEKVEINETVGTNVTILEVTVDETDVGKIIGKEGKTAASIRTIIKSIAKKNGTRIIIEIV